MCNESIIRRFAGVFVLLSVVLGWFVHPAWFLFTAFVGVNLLQSSFTSLCPRDRERSPRSAHDGGGRAAGGIAVARARGNAIVRDPRTGLSGRFFPAQAFS